MKVLGGLWAAPGDVLQCPGAKYIGEEKLEGSIHGDKEFASFHSRYPTMNGK
jgi:hypothetical protein